MKTEFTKAELQAAYEMCILIKSNSDNVLASGEDSKSDREWSRKAGKFIKAYERVNAHKLAREGKAGHMGNALKLMGDIQNTLKDIKL